MANGRLFAVDMTTANQTLYNPAGVNATLTISLCNRTAKVVTVRLALASTAAPTDAEWIEYDTPLPPFGVLERTAIVIGSGQYLVAKAAAVGVSAVGFGFEE